jgi:hypothetical protein
MEASQLVLGGGEHGMGPSVVIEAVDFEEAGMPGFHNGSDLFADQTFAGQIHQQQDDRMHHNADPITVHWPYLIRKWELVSRGASTAGRRIHLLRRGGVRLMDSVRSGYAVLSFPVWASVRRCQRSKPTLALAAITPSLRSRAVGSS